MRSPNPGKIGRRNCVDIPIEQKPDRQRELDQVMALLNEAVSSPHSDTKRLIFIEGDSGIGKSCLLSLILDSLQKSSTKWRIASPELKTKVPFDASNFVNANAYVHFISLMNECAGRTLLDIGKGKAITQEDVIQCANTLHIELTTMIDEPLLLVFDELEWWLDIDSRQREILNTLFRIVWRVLLRFYAMPCVIICAGRRQPEWKDVLLKRTLRTIPIGGFALDDLYKLVTPPLLPYLQRSLEVKSVGNPLIAQLLEDAYLGNPNALVEPVYSVETLPWLFDQVVGERLSPVLHTTLYRLARERPNGFHPDDPLLPEGDTTISKLVRTAFVEFNTNSHRYQVAKVLSNLF